MQSAILNRITSYYLDSSHFNGMPVCSLAEHFDVELEDLIPRIKHMVTNKTASVVFGDLHPNPYIRALPDEPVSNQVAKLIPQKLEFACIYPLQKHLKQVVQSNRFVSRPFSLKLALGAPQYTFDFFDPSVLEHYLRHPACQVVSDVRGTLVFPKTQINFARASFGHAYGHQFIDLIASNFGQLSLLSEADQKHWYTMSLPARGTLHPDVAGPLFKGEFREKLSVFEALLAEMKAVNALCLAIDKPPLFIFHTDPDRQIKHFGFISVPNVHNFGQFFLHYQILLLQNINPAFLASIEKPAYQPVHPKRRRQLSRPAKTLLEYVGDWIVTAFSIQDEGLIARLAEYIKTTRRDFNTQVLNGYGNNVDLSFMHIQRRLMWYAYEAVKWIRQIIEQYINEKHAALHPLLREGRVWVI